MVEDNEENELVEDIENEEEYEDENSAGSEEEEIGGTENLDEEVETVDTFTEMKNMYRPKTDNQSVKNDEPVDVKDESKDEIDLNESDVEDEEEEEEGDIEGSENSEDLEEEEDEEEISDVDDEDLMKRLESKYGKLPERRNSSEEEEVDEKWTSNFKQ